MISTEDLVELSLRIQALEIEKSKADEYASRIGAHQCNIDAYGRVVVWDDDGKPMARLRLRIPGYHYCLPNNDWIRKNRDEFARSLVPKIIALGYDEPTAIYWSRLIAKNPGRDWKDNIEVMEVNPDLKYLASLDLGLFPKEKFSPRTAEETTALVREIRRYAPDEALARHLAALIPDRPLKPLLDEYRRVFVMDGEKCIARLPHLESLDNGVFYWIDFFPDIRATVEWAKVLISQFGFDERLAVEYGQAIEWHGPVLDREGRVLVVDFEGGLITRLELPYDVLAKALQPPQKKKRFSGSRP